MHIDLSGKTALVTASTGGIGLATASGLAAAGATVIVNGRSAESVDRALDQIHTAVPGADLHGLAADAGTAEGCTTLVERLSAPDILVNNLGIHEPRDVFDLSDEDWQHHWEVNVMSGVRLSRAWLPAMADRGWGRTIFLSSESALNIPVDMVHYGVSKTACLALSRGLAKRMAGTGVTVNAVLPGPTMSESVRAELEPERERTGKSIEELADDMATAERPTSIIQRCAKPEEVANLIVYLASPQSSATTGAALRVDGGIVDSIA